MNPWFTYTLIVLAAIALTVVLFAGGHPMLGILAAFAALLAFGCEPSQDSIDRHQHRRHRGY